MLNPNTYYTVQAWFITDLHLKGNELHAFAIIYGFSQDQRSYFRGSLSYIAEWLGCTRRSAINAINSLVNKRLVEKEPGANKGIDSNRYKVNFYTVDTMRRGNENNSPGVVKNLHAGGENISPNNYIDTDIDNYRDKESIKTPSPAPKIDYQSIKDLYNDTCISFAKITALSDSRKKLIKARAEQYDLQTIQKVFETAQASDFLKGKNARGWKANFDWLMNDANFAKVLDGNYNNTQRPADIPPADDIIFNSMGTVPTFGSGLAMGPNGVLIDKTADNTDLPWEI